MNFVQSTFLIALTGLAIPVIVHLIYRRQQQLVDLGTLRFLTDLLQENASRRRLKQWLLLAARFLCVAALVILFARPFLIAQDATSRNIQTLILIDDSASMSQQAAGQSLIDTAIQHATALIDSQNPESRWEVAYFHQDVEVIATDKNPPTSLSEILHQKKSSWGPTSYSSALNWVQEKLKQDSGHETQVHIYTDLQRTGMDGSDALEFPTTVKFFVHELGEESASNLAVTRAIPLKTVVRPGESNQFQVGLANTGKISFEDISVFLTLVQNEVTIHREIKASIRAGQSSEIQFEVPELNEGIWEGFVTADVNDDYAFDNRTPIALLVAAKQNVLLIDGSAAPEEQHLPDSFFLERAIRVDREAFEASQSPFAVERIVQHEIAGLKNLDRFDSVVLLNVPELAEERTKLLKDFVSAGGGLLVLTGENVTPTSTTNLQISGLAPGEILETVRTVDLPFRWDRWESRHPMLVPFSDPQSGDLQRFSFEQYTKITPNEQTRVLAHFQNGDPALTSHQLGEGKIVWFLSNTNRSWSDVTRSRLFLPLVHQMLGDLTNQTGGGPVQYHIIDDWEMHLSQSEQTAPPSPRVVKQQGRWHVFQNNPAESDLDRCRDEELAEKFGFQLATNAPQPQVPSLQDASSTRFESRPDEIWPVCAALLLGLALFEFYLGNRTVA